MVTRTVSVVIPAYNHAEYLEEAIESILAQDYPDIELIVLDDGSTDATPQVLARYAGRFFCETQKNVGQAATLNKGWSMARGDILGYLSADDLLLPRAVAAAAQCLTEHPEVVLSYCDFNLIDHASRLIRRVRVPDYDYREMVTRLACPPGPGAFFRRSAFEQAGAWDGVLRQMPDFDYWLRLGLLGEFRRIPEVLAAFRVHPMSQTFGATNEQRAAEPVLIVERYFDNASLPPYVAPWKAQALSNANLVSAQLHLRAGRFRSAYHRLRQAWSLFPRNVLSASALRMLMNALFNRLGHRFTWTIRRVIAASGLAGRSK